MIDDWLDRHDAAQILSVTNDDLSVRIFDAQIATEQLVSALWALDPNTAWPSDSTRQPLHWERACRTIRRTTNSAVARTPSPPRPRQVRPSTSGYRDRRRIRAVQAHLAIHHITTNALRPESAEPEPEPPAEEAAELD